MADKHDAESLALWLAAMNQLAATAPEEKPMMLTQLAAVARRTGYPVVEVPGWKQRGHGPMESVDCITAHHTANGGAAGNAPSLAVVRDGRPGLEGPLAHYVLGRDGTVIVVAAGLCYHAGVSRSPQYTNSHAVGIEAEAVGVPGTRGDWPPVQMDAYARLCAALIAEFGLAVDDVRGHKETCSPPGRKTDPSFNMNAFREQVAAVDLNQEDVMQPSDWEHHKLTEADARALGDPKREGEEVGWSSLLRFPPSVERVRDEQTTQNAALKLEVARGRADVAAVRAELALVRGQLAEIIARLPGKK